MSEKPLERQLTDEERKKYDRAGFIGHQVQKRLLASNILIKGMNGCNSELAKNLILAGANITIVDDQLITERDTDTNFLFSKEMIGLKRGEQAQKELLEINPLVKILLLEQFPVNDELKQYNAIVTSTIDFDEMQKYDEISQTLNIPYYNLVCCGYYGFMYIGLGTRFIYEREKKVVLQIVFGKKLQDQDRYQEFEEVIATSEPFDKTFDYNFKSRTYEVDLVYYCILMMKKVNSIPELKQFDPFNPNEDILNQITEIGKEIFQNATGKDADEQQVETFKKFAKFYGVDYCPVYSVIGSVASQELIISTSRINEPALNWFCFNSQSCFGQVEVIQDTSKFPVRDLPERKKLIPKE